MRGKSIVLIVIALGCGLVASIGISQVLGRSATGPAPKVETEKVLVAMLDIDINQPLTAENVKLEDWPKDRIPQGAVRDLEETTDLLPKTRLYAGEVVLLSKLSDSTGGNSDDIPAGYRVMAVKVDDQKSVAGLILPGDQVDVMVFMRQNSEIPLTTTQTVLRDVRVFAVDQKVDRDVDQDGKSITARTVSLIVKPEEGETLMLAANLGTLSLSLRRPNDATDEDSGGATVDKLLSAASSSAVPHAAAAPLQPSSGESLKDWLDRVKNPTADSGREEEPTPTEAVSAYQWSMTMHTPDGIQLYQWNDPKALPSEVPAGTAGALAPPLPSDMNTTGDRRQEGESADSKTQPAEAPQTGDDGRKDRGGPWAAEAS